MKGKGKVLKGVSIGLTLYWLVSVPVYLMEGDSLAGHPVIGALYLGFIAVHEGLVLVALLFQWLGVLKNKRWAVNIAILLMIVAMVVLAILIYPVLALLPLIVIDIFGKLPKTESETT